MRTVDPELWSRKVKGAGQVGLRSRFGQRQASRGLETRLRQSLWDAAEEYWQNCSLAAARLYQIDHNKYKRRQHVCVLVLTLVMGCALLVHNSAQLLARPPLVVSQQLDDTSITDYGFPAVALCSNQVISKAALKTFTRYLYNHPKNKEYGFRESEIEHSLLDMGALLTLALPPAKPDFEQFFRDAEPNFNVTDIMFKLAPNCSAILQRCSWRGELVACERLFASRLTTLGFCCVFNSRYQPSDQNSEPAVLDLTGQDYGLGVVVQETGDDFAYERRPMYGMELLLFEGDEYPLLESGDVRLYPLPRDASLYFNVRAALQLPADELRSYTEERRDCRLEGGGTSSCLAACRRGAARALCGCEPAALQPQALLGTCTLSDLACLNKHREKFMYVFPGSGAHPQLRQELQDALDCGCRPRCRRLRPAAAVSYCRPRCRRLRPAAAVSYCRPRCRRLRPAAAVSYSFYSGKERTFRNFLSANLSLVNSTTIRLFYSVDHQECYKVEALARVFENFVWISAQWMAITGVSILSYSELLYYCTFRWMHHFTRRTRINRTH